MYYESFAFFGPLAVILADLIDFLIQFVKFLLIILIFRYKSREPMRISAGALSAHPDAAIMKNRIRRGNSNDLL